MRIEDIYHYQKVDERISTAGQPTEEQLRAAVVEGFTTVINLAPIDPDQSLKDEAGLVRSLGMTYHHIPVDWENPQDSDFAAFEAIMQASSAEKILIHCAANFRVTAFYSLYAMKRLGWTELQADEFRASIWAGSNYPIWEKFISDMKGRISRPGE
jgi:uncharacterized protein (TIGR01244 family)